MSSYKEGQVHQLLKRLEKEGFTSEHLTKLGQLKDLQAIKNVLDGLSEIKLIGRLIDCDADPFLPKDWKVEEHKKGGKIQWNPEKVKLYLSANQNGRVIVGNELRKELSNKPVLNANALDFFSR